jgi:hypothetical protein
MQPGMGTVRSTFGRLEARFGVAVAIVSMLVTAMFMTGQLQSVAVGMQAAGEPDVGNHPLLPDIRSTWPTSVHIVMHGDTRRLFFSSTLANFGRGPLEVVPRPDGSCPLGQRRVDQAVYQDADRNGFFKRGTDIRRVFNRAGCMVFHVAHNHWHVEGSAKYKLTRPGDGTPLAKRSKVSFCLRDIVKKQPTRRAAFYGACSRDRRQGITPGWGDLYRYTLPDQFLNLPRNLPRGLYCLHQMADPTGIFIESNEHNNNTIRPIRIRGTNVRYVDSDRCRAT